MGLARFGGQGMPSSWYQIAWSGQIPDSGVLPLRYFGRDLVLTRTASGEVALYDAYCPHMGAHLGFGGCMKGENLVCPFHGWEWDPDGKNVAVPYSDHTNQSKVLQRWPVQEVGGSTILAWYDPDGGVPTHEPPEVPELGSPDFYPVYPSRARHYPGLAMHPEWVPENTVDMAHFQFVHETPAVPTMIDLEADGPRMEVRFSMPMKHFTPDTERGSGATNVVDAIATTTCYGLGVMVTRFAVDDSVLFQSHTPVDEETTEIFFNVVVRRVDDGDEPTGGSAARVNMLCRQIENDLLIWTHRRMEPRPALAREEARGFKLFNDWKKQFYAAPLPS